MAGRFTVESVFKAVDRVTAPVSRMQQKLLRFTRSAERSMRRLNRAVGKVARGFGKAGRALAKWGGAAAAALGFATVRAINTVADRLDALAKQSRRLQFPVEELQEWKFVAEQSGVSSELLDKSLGAFSKRLGEAAGNMGPLVSGLKKTHPQLLQQLKQSESVAAAFELYIDAMRGAKTATEKAALANAAFSRSGLALANISDNSSAAIQALRKEQRENGVVTMAQAMAAEEYNDALNSLKRSIGGLIQTAVVPLMSRLSGVLRMWREWIVEYRELIATRVTEFIIKAKNALEDLVLQVQNLNSQHALLEKIVAVAKAVGVAFSFVVRHGELILKIVASVIALSAALKILTAVMTVVNIVMAANPVGLIVLGITALIAAIAAALIWWDEIKAAMVSFAQTVSDKIVGAFSWLKETFVSLPSPIKAAIAALAGPVGWVAGAAAMIMENWEPIKGFFTSLWDRIVGTFNAAVARITAVVDRVKRAASAIVDTISSIGGGVADFFGFGDEGEDDVERIQQRAQVVAPQDRVARSIEERVSVNTAEVTIRDDTGRAEVSRGRLGSGLRLQPSGAF